MRENDATEIAYMNGKDAGRAEAFNNLRKKLIPMAEDSRGVQRAVLHLVLNLITQTEQELNR